MKSNFMRFISYVIGTLAIATGTTLADSTGAGASPRDLLNQSVPEPVPVLTADETIANQQIEFKTLVPEKSFVLPQEGKEVSIKFGLRITNNSSLERQFVAILRSPSFVIGDRRQARIAPECASDGHPNLVNPVDFLKALKPGESVEVFDTATLYRKDGQVIIWHMSHGKSCRFTGLKAGPYAVFINYQGSPRLWSVEQRDLWLGEVNSIPAKFELMESR
jgi:hypothetical protein